MCHRHQGRSNPFSILTYARLLGPEGKFSGSHFILSRSWLIWILHSHLPFFVTFSLFAYFLSFLFFFFFFVFALVIFVLMLHLPRALNLMRDRLYLSANSFCEEHLTNWFLKHELLWKMIVYLPLIRLNTGFIFIFRRVFQCVRIIWDHILIYSVHIFCSLQMNERIYPDPSFTRTLSNMLDKLIVTHLSLRL